MLGNNFPKEGNILFWEGLSFKLEKVLENEIEEVEIESTDGEKHIIRRDEDDEELDHQPAEDIDTSAYSAK